MSAAPITAARVQKRADNGPATSDMSSGSTLEAAQAYIVAGWHLLVANPRTKRPLTEHGLLDATSDIAVIAGWLRRWPDALLAGRTGAISGRVVLDIDVTDTLSGWDALDELGISFAPTTPMAHSPRGGTHCFFNHPGVHVKTTAGKLGRGLDVRADGGYIILPPGPGRSWDAVYGLDTPLADMPPWMIAAEPAERRATEPRPARHEPIGVYGAAALERGIRAILDAPAGGQRDTINREAYGIGQLVAGREIPADIAIRELEWAAGKVRAHDPRRPWRPGECLTIARQAYLDGQRLPRSASHGR